MLQFDGVLVITVVEFARQDPLVSYVGVRHFELVIVGHGRRMVLDVSAAGNAESGLLLVHGLIEVRLHADLGLILSFALAQLLIWNLNGQKHVCGCLFALRMVDLLQLLVELVHLVLGVLIHGS